MFGLGLTVSDIWWGMISEYQAVAIRGGALRKLREPVRSSTEQGIYIIDPPAAHLVSRLRQTIITLISDPYIPFTRTRGSKKITKEICYRAL